VSRMGTRSIVLSDQYMIFEKETLKGGGKKRVGLGGPGTYRIIARGKNTR